MSFTPVWISILREKRTGDGAGGKITVLYSLRARYQATIARQRKSDSEMRLEQGAHNSQGPGVETAYKRVMCFKPPFPTLLTNDVLVAHDGSDNGVQYVAHDARSYDWTLQVDVENVR